MSKSKADSSNLLKSLVYLILVSTSLFIAPPIILWLLTRDLLSFDFGVYRFLGLVPLALGSVLAFWSTVSFPKFGEGTPAHSDPPKKLTTKGLFKYTRNPMYLGATLTLIGQTIIFESPVVLLLTVLVWFLLHLLVVYYEEPELRRRFGKTYEEYAKNVPRWLI